MPPTPNKKLAILTCMDARIDPLDAMGIDVGDAHVLRNAGGLVTEDVLRSLETSRKLGTEDIVVIGHTDCGLGPGEDDRVRDAVAQLGDSASGSVRGYVFDVESRELREIV